MCNRKGPAFISRELRNWEKAGDTFLECETSDCPKDYNKFKYLVKNEVDIGEQMTDSFANEKAKKREINLTILQNEHFLQDKVLPFVQIKNKEILMS